VLSFGIGFIEIVLVDIFSFVSLSNNSQEMLIGAFVLLCAVGLVISEYVTVPVTVAVVGFVSSIATTGTLKTTFIAFR
jgi:hypothetical protein